MKFAKNLADALRRMPMLPAAAVFVSGVLFFDRFAIGQALLWTSFALYCLAAGVLWRRRVARSCIAAALFLLGGVVWSLHGRTERAEPEAVTKTTLHDIAAERFSRLELNPETAAAAGAIGTGDRSRMTPELREAYSRSGVSHILAVSGLHIGIIFVLANALFRVLTVLRHGQIAAWLAVLVPVWLYAAASGFSPSVVRAAVMFSMLQLSLSLSSSYSSVNMLAAAAFAMVAFNPATLFDISFQLSFIVVAAIVIFGVPLFGIVDRRNRVVRFLWDTFVVGAVSFVAAAPLVSHLFGRVSLAGVVVNPIVILCAGVIVAVSVVWVLVPVALLQPAAEWVLDFTTGIQNRVVTVLSGFDWMVVDIRLSAGAVLGIYAVLAAGAVVLVGSGKGEMTNRF